MKTRLLSSILLISYFTSNAQWSVVGSGSIPGTTGNVYELKVYNNKLYCAGALSSFDAATINAEDIGKWDGTSWSGVTTGINNGSGVYSLEPYQNELYVGGVFYARTGGGGCSDTMIDAINPSDIWSNTAGLGLKIDAAGVNALAVYSGELYAGGFFSYSGAFQTGSIARWNGSAWSTAVQSNQSTAQGTGYPGLYTGVYALLTDTVNNLLYAGGDFTNIGFPALPGTIVVNSIAQWNGSAWSPLGSGMKPYPTFTTPDVFALAIYNGELYAGGKFDSAGVIKANSIAKWNGTNWSALGTGLAGNGGNPIVYDMRVFNNKLVIAGNFDTANSVSCPGVVQWDGSNFSTVGTGLNNNFSTTYALEVYQNCLYIGGGYYTIGAQTAYGVAKFCGVTGIENLENNNDIKLYPNPFCTQTVLQTDNFLSNATLTVYNSFGQTVKQIKNISGQTVVLSRDNLASGLYFVRLTEENKTIAVDKLVINDK